MRAGKPRRSLRSRVAKAQQRTLGGILLGVIQQLIFYVLHGLPSRESAILIVAEICRMSVKEEVIGGLYNEVREKSARLKRRGVQHWSH